MNIDDIFGTPWRARRVDIEGEGNTWYTVVSRHGEKITLALPKKYAKLIVSAQEGYTFACLFREMIDEGFAMRGIDGELTPDYESLVELCDAFLCKVDSKVSK